ncbi:hypothetical protein TWF225_010200 [Orbilia oligospora]|nr:hypothetical protein TWF225_010200 [Orbilia oligospora]KAF3249761.1 hypothetical protein TWF128_007761 [Orbilia oligospora]KAF3261465.1 hypothetical protein TWF217_004602 [Orbilia oligospora]
MAASNRSNAPPGLDPNANFQASDINLQPPSIPNPPTLLPGLVYTHNELQSALISDYPEPGEEHPAIRTSVENVPLESEVTLGFGPFAQDPRLPDLRNLNINHEAENNHLENDENRDWEGSQFTDNSSVTLGQSDAASLANSDDTVVNQLQYFPIVLPINHPLFDPFIHDTALWPRPEVLEQWDDDRIQLEIQETLGVQLPPGLLGPFPYHPRYPNPFPNGFRRGPAGQSAQNQPQFQGVTPYFTLEQLEASVVFEPRRAPGHRRPEQQHPLARAAFTSNNQGIPRAGHSQPQLGRQLNIGQQTPPIRRSSTHPVIVSPGSASRNGQTQIAGPRVAELFQQGLLLGLGLGSPPTTAPQAPEQLPQLGSPIHFQNGPGGEELAGLDVNRPTRSFEGNLLGTDQAAANPASNIGDESQTIVVEWEIMRNKAALYEQEINRLLELRDTGDGALERELDERTVGLRHAVEEMIFGDIEYCHHNEVAGKCWMIHHKIILRYSKAIGSLKKDGKRPVELRKVYTYFTKFIKLSSKFYRALIQRLISHFGVQNLKFVAIEFKFEIDTSDREKDYSSQIQNFATLVCYESLLHLGDLSRYRENYGEPNPRNPDAKNWGPAKGYYTLARKVIPAHPKAFNQLAVLAQYEQSHFTAIYYLYRSLLAEEPDEATHETTLGNLKICFVKILKDNASTDGAASDEITSMFSRYHAHCFLSNDASEYESLKSDLLNQITLAVKERAVPAVILNRMILINIAAEHLALSRDRATLSSPKVVTFLRFNVETFTSILMVLQQELDGTSQDSREDVADLVSAVTRRMLPSLRLYSAWLLISHHILVNETNDMSLNVQVKQLWQTYATTLSLLQSTFPMRSLSQSPYLLEEDDDIAGFKPLMDTSESRRLGKGVAGVQGRDHPNQESLTRILYLLEDGIELCTAGNVPIDVKNNTFAFQDGIISTDSNTGNTEYPTITLRDIPVTGGIRATSTASRLGQANHMGSVISEPASTTLTNKMNAMVDDLVGSSHSREDSDDEEEVIVFKGRRSFFTPLQSNPKASLSTPAINNATITAKSPMVAQVFAQPIGGGSAPGLGGTIGPSSSKGKAPIPSNYMAPYTETVTDSAQPSSNQPTSPASLLTASDLVTYVQNYASRMTIAPPTTQSPQTNLTTGQAGPSNMSLPQSGPPDAVTPKLSSASLERPAQVPQLAHNSAYYDGHSASSVPFNSMSSNFVQNMAQPSMNASQETGAYFRNSAHQHPMARENARMPPRHGPYNHYYH